MRKSDPDDDLMPLERARKWIVKRYRAHPASWPDGIGAWYRPEEWLDSGEYVGREIESNRPGAESNTSPGFDRIAYQRQYMRQRRAAAVIASTNTGA